MNAMQNPVAQRSRSAHLRIELYKQRYLLLMLAPALLLTLLFCYLPLAGWYIAFSDYTVGQGLFDGQFTGLYQFKKLFGESKDMIYLIRNTLVMNIGAIVINLPLAGVLAVLLKELPWKRGAKIIQSVSFFPYFISWVIAYSLMLSLFSVNSGSINNFLVRMGVIPRGINLLGSPAYSWGLVIALDAWKFTGYNCVIFLSSLSGIPQEQFEAAALDGANRFQKILYVTVPNLIPTLGVLLIMNSGWILSSNLEEFFIFTNGTNWETMEVLDMYIYKFGLKMLKFPYATAVGMVKSVISVLMICLVNFTVKRLSDTSMF